MPAGRKELTSWKEIADYLGVSVRTAQKWETQRGLPVRRFPGEKGRVSADPAALDRWRETTLEKPRWWTQPGFLRLWAAAATAALLVAAGVYLASSRKGPPALFRHEGNVLVVTDAQGRELWRHTFEQPFGQNVTPDNLLQNHQAWFGDLDADGRTELLYSYHPTAIDKHGVVLFCFSHDGREKWRFTPGRRVSTRSLEFPPPYRVNSLLPLAPGPDHTRKLVVTSHHISRYPNQVVVLAHTGAVLGEYWHSGQLTQVELADLDGDGSEEILLAGISNGNRAATLVVLDPRDLAGASLEENPDYQLQGFPPGREKARIVFPRSCINRKFHEYNWPLQLAFSGDRIRLGVRQREPDFGSAVVYYLDRRLGLIGLEFPDYLRSLHRELEAAGQLDHMLTDAEIAQLRNIRYLKRPNW